MWWARIRLLSYISYFRPRGQTFVRLYHRRLDHNSQAHNGLSQAWLKLTSYGGFVTITTSPGSYFPGPFDFLARPFSARRNRPRWLS